MNLLILSIAPVFIIAVYIYFRDKYEKEPLNLLLLSLFAGSLICIFAIFIENLISQLNFFTDKIATAFFDAFAVAAFTEEFLKYITVLILVWRNKNFNERFDGIVYAVFVSLGFALIENIFFVFKSGMSTGIVRAVTAVPLHAFTGVFMGFYLGLAKFISEKRNYRLFLAFFFPFIIHGLYDFFLMTQNAVFILIWLPFFIIIWIKSFRKIKNLSDSSWNDSASNYI